MAHTVRGLKLSSEFRKAPYLDHCCLTYFYAIYSNFSPIYILPTTQMITPPTQLTEI